MKKLKIILPLIALSLFSCDQYLDINQDPNNLYANQVGANKYLPGAQVGSYRVQATTMNQLGSVMTNAWGSNVASFTGGFAREFQLNIDNAFYNGIFDGLFLNVNNFQQIINLKNTDHTNDNYIAAAKICKAHYMQYLVDLYGDIPYNNAFLGLANINPSYNDDQAIYRKLLTELDEARALILAADPAAISITQYDVMLQGNMTKWDEFANTLELRYLLRMSNSTGAVAAYRDARLAALVGKPFLTSDVNINPGYSVATDAQMNPFNNVFSYTAAGTAQQNWTFVAMSGHAYKFMKNNAPTNNTLIDPAFAIKYPGVNDGRSSRLFRGSTKAVTQGSTTVDVPTAGGTPGRLGYGLFNPYLVGSEAINVGQDITNLGTANGFVMTKSEAYFLQAEAAVRYPSLFAYLGAQTSWNAGIDASFERLGVPTPITAANSYRAGISTKPGIGWAASTTDDLKYSAIMTQKWIALMGIHGIESFIDYNRTGFPVTPLALSAGQPRKPRRLIYPVSEYVANSANVPNITQTQIFAVTDPSHPFWMLGNPTLGN